MSPSTCMSERAVIDHGRRSRVTRRRFVGLAACEEASPS